jgi:RNA polymerase sigma factor (sigma-70 family)
VNDWSVQAACRTTDPDELFLQGAAQSRLKAACSGCPVRTECLADALDNRVEFGVWGGMSERERGSLLRRRPKVTSWRQLLEAARTEYEAGAGLLVLERPEQPTDPDATDTLPERDTAAPWPAGWEPPAPGTWQQRRCLSPRQEQQFAAVFRDRFVPVVGFLRAAGAGRHDAEDAVQAAFVHLAQVWDTVEYPTAWLRTTAWRMWLRGKGNARAWPSDPADLPDAAIADPCGDIAGQVDLVQLLRQLSPLQRTVMAFEIDGATPAQTAEALGVPAVNVRQNLLRARRNLERLLNDPTEGGPR